MCVTGAPTAFSLPRRTKLKQGPTDDAWNFKLTRRRELSGRNKNRFQGVMNSRRRAIQTVGRRLQLPSTAAALRVPFHRAPKKYFATKVTRLQKGVFNVHAPLTRFFCKVPRDMA